MQDLQQEIDHIQALYREWTALYPQLQAAQQQWLHACTIMAELQRFYFGGQYARAMAAYERGEPLNLHTEGEYSVVSEDALWDAHNEHYQLAWERIRSTLPLLDPANAPDSDNP